MARDTEERITEHRHTAITKRICDCCGADCWSPHDGNWTRESFYFKHTTIELYEGERFPDCAEESTKTTLDVCPTCMRDFVIPMICARGKSTPTVTHYEEDL